MKKLLSILLAGAMVLSLAACGGDTGTSTSEPASASTGTSESASATGGIPKDEIKVGVIHLSDPAEGSGYTYTHDRLDLMPMVKNLL